MCLKKMVFYFSFFAVGFSSSAADPLYVSRVLTEEHGFTGGIEGPAVDGSQMIYAVNYKAQGTIGKITPEGEACLYVELPQGSIGNGIRFNRTGEMLIADYKKHNILKVNPETMEISVYAHHPDMNQPNDIAISAADVLYASDPNWGGRTGNIWRIDPDGSVTLLDDEMGTTNGIEVSPDDRKLYINETVQRNVWVYDLSATGEISNKRLLIQFADYGLDGMRCDIDGNLYITRHGKGTVVKVSPTGEILREIRLTGNKPSNIAFGGPEGKTCYVTLADRGNVEVFKVECAGRSWALR